MLEFLGVLVMLYIVFLVYIGNKMPILMVRCDINYVKGNIVIKVQNVGQNVAIINNMQIYRFVDTTWNDFNNYINDNFIDNDKSSDNDLNVVKSNDASRLRLPKKYFMYSNNYPVALLANNDEILLELSMTTVSNANLDKDIHEIWIKLLTLLSKTKIKIDYSSSYVSIVDNLQLSKPNNIFNLGYIITPELLKKVKHDQVWNIATNLNIN